MKVAYSHVSILNQNLERQISIKKQCPLKGIIFYNLPKRRTECCSFNECALAFFTHVFTVFNDLCSS